LENRVEDRIGKTHIKILVPEIKDYTTTVLSGDDANSSFAYKYEVPGRIIERNFPEAKGHRIMLSPAEPSKEDSFLTFFQLSAEHISPIEVKHRENEHFHELSFTDYIICMNKELDLISDKFTLKLPSNSSSSKIILAGLKEGKWIVKRNDGKIIFDVDVLPNKNTIYFQSPEGVYDIIPGR
jgi:heparin/heparan-sulfate lyase